MKIGPAQIGALYGPWNGSPHHKPRKLPQGYPEAKRPPDNAGGLLQVTLCTKGNLGAGEGIRTLDPDLGKVRVVPLLPITRDYQRLLAIDL